MAVSHPYIDEFAQVLSLLRRGDPLPAGGSISKNRS